MKKVFYIIIFFYTVNFYSQELTCKDFQTGTFTMNSNEVDEEYTIVRTLDSQTETTTKQSNNSTLEVAYEKIEWIDECTYRLKYDESKMKLGEIEQFINDNNGVVTTVTKIIGYCFYFDTIFTFNGETKKMSGEICKVFLP